MIDDFFINRRFSFLEPVYRCGTSQSDFNKRQRSSEGMSKGKRDRQIMFDKLSVLEIVVGDESHVT